MRRGSIIAAIAGFVLAAIYYALADVLRKPWRKQ
jgi:hypothetical protein